MGYEVERDLSIFISMFALSPKSGAHCPFIVNLEGFHLAPMKQR